MTVHITFAGIDSFLTTQLNIGKIDVPAIFSPLLKSKVEEHANTKVIYL